MNVKYFFKFIFSVVLTCLCLGFVGNCGSSTKNLTQSYIQQITKTPTALPQALKQTTFTGCEMVPATGNKPQIEGTEYTGNTCFIKIYSNEEVEVSFLGSTTYPLSLLEKNSDHFVSQIDDDEVLILQVQLYQNKILGATHTSYDRNGYLNYGASGQGGQFIKSCSISLQPPCVY